MIILFSVFHPRQQNSALLPNPLTPLGGHSRTTCSIVFLSLWHKTHILSISWYLALYVFFVSTPVLAQNSKELPRQWSNSYTHLESCFRDLYMAKANFPCILPSRIFPFSSFSLSFPELVCSVPSLACGYLNRSFRVRCIRFVFTLFMYKYSYTFRDHSLSSISVNSC